MIKRWAFLLLVTASASGNAADGSTYIFTRAESFSYSEGSPLTAFLNLLVGPAPAGGDTVFSRNRFETGFGYKKFELSFIHRNDYNLNYTPDAAMFAYQNKNRVPITLGQEYDIDIWANQYQASGAKLAYQWDLSKKFNITLAYSHLYGTEAISGTLGPNEKGEGGVIKMMETTTFGRTRRVIDGTLYTDYFYTHDPFFDRAVEPPVGQGYAVDIGFNWHVNDKLTVEGVIQDIAGEMRWSQMPHTTAIARSDVIVVRDDGFVETNPNFAGTESFGNFTQELTQRQLLTTRYRWHKILVGHQYEGYDVVQLNRLILGYHWSERWGLDVAAEVKSSAVDLRLTSPLGAFSLTTDTLSIDDARTLGLTWNMAYRF